MARRKKRAVDKFELDHGATREEWPLIKEFRALVDWFQRLEDMGANQWRPAKSEKYAKRDRLRELVIHFGCEEDKVDAVVLALTKQHGYFSRATVSLDVVSWDTGGEDGEDS